MFSVKITNNIAIFIVLFEKLIEIHNLNKLKLISCSADIFRYFGTCTCSAYYRQRR